MKKIILFLGIICSCCFHAQAFGDPLTPPKDSAFFEDDLVVKIQKNLIQYSYQEGEAMYVQTVDQYERPLSCILSINRESKYHYVPVDGELSFEKDLEIKHISVFHDAKIYDFVPDQSYDYNKLTLILNTQSQEFDLFEDRLRKINNTETSPKKKRMKLVDHRHRYPDDFATMVSIDQWDVVEDKGF